ncbi:MAG: ParB/RepB/Spo0J family partition protein [Desulfuromonadaceae bacterium]|nr:ParB/RepB/Spo0J family partition protein [Desulfuromonadaceae bacterium]MDD2849653.1 ParB/RepB/Spo0J family partition protein [Desulfuromonadaceae bacterium]MDD4131675.1 ParB/RepB/Spo0J family partition protein [Desulfuromonadaceae bacterium]
MENIADYNFVHGIIYGIKCAAIQPNPNNPRKHISQDAMDTLVESIKSCGLVHAITFTLRGDQLEVVSGERRWRAFQNAGIEYIQAKYVDRDLEAIALAENFQREDLTPLEKAEFLLTLQTKHGYDLAQLAKYVGKSVTSVSELLSLRRLPEDIKEACRNSNKYCLTRLVQIAKTRDQESQRRLFRVYQQELDGEKFRGEPKRYQSDITKTFTRLDRIYADILKVETEHMTEKDLCILFSKFNIVEQVINKIAREYGG